MIALAIRFPAGRFHATPWGRHVNEAAPEWPPSPWRLLRALVATWKRKLDGDPRCAPDVVERLLRALAEPPLFALPPATASHTRHYMPWFKKGPNDKTMVFDAFVAVGKENELVCMWPSVRLGGAEHAALVSLTESLGFLGRAESWVEARVLSDAEAADAETRVDCVPLWDGNEKMKSHEPIRVLTADPIFAFDNQYTPKHVAVEGRGKNKREIVTPLYSPDWHLCMETLELHDKRWSDPPGSRWIAYLRRKDCFAVEPRSPAPRKKRSLPTIARFALDSPVLPLVEDTIRVAEAARYTAMGCFRRVTQGGPENPLPKSEALSGKNGDGAPLEGHNHAFYLPTDEDGDGRLDHLTILAEMSFGPAEVKALDRMRTLKRDEGEPINMVLMALGQREAIVAPGLFGPSRIWISATPFLATRHAKTRGRKKDPTEVLGLENQRAFAALVLREEIDRLRTLRPEVPPPESVEPLNEAHCCGAHRLRPIQFKRFRRKRGDDGGRRAAGAFRIVFPEPVRGPICLGHSSHFGLGLFVPEGEREP